MMSASAEAVQLVLPKEIAAKKEIYIAPVQNSKNLVYKLPRSSRKLQENSLQRLRSLPPSPENKNLWRSTSLHNISASVGTDARSDAAATIYDRISLHAVSDTNRIADAEEIAEVNSPLPQQKIAGAPQFAAQIIMQTIEILQGKRPLRQVQTWMNPQVYQALARRVYLGLRLNGGPSRCPAPRIRRVRTYYPRPDIAEVCVIVYDGKKIRAAALRLEVRRQHWHVTALEII